MSIKSIKTGFTGISALAGNDQWFGDFEAIAVTTLNASAANVEFTSIPSTYQHLQLRAFYLSGSSNQNLAIQFNGDTASNYALHELYGSGATAGAIGTADTVFASAGFTPGSTHPGIAIVDILDYKNTSKYTTTRTIWGHDVNGSGGYVGMSSGLWENTNAITSIKLYHTNSNNFNTYSSFALYGIRG
jgi:hypothetical protein